MYVDNSGPTVSVSVRTAAKPWNDRLAITVNGRTTNLTRKGTAGTDTCGPTVVAEPTSLLTRVNFERSCVATPPR